MRFACTGVYCFTDDTPIWLADGTKIGAGHLHVGDRIVAWDECTQSNRIDRVTNVTITKPQEAVFALCFDEGTQPIKVTGGHPFYVDGAAGGRWKLTRDVVEGDVFKTIAGKRIHLKRKYIVPEDSRTRVVDISVENDHTLYAGELGVLAHNACLRDIFRDLNLLRNAPDIRVGWFKLWELAYPKQLLPYFVRGGVVSDAMVTDYRVLLGTRVRALNPKMHEWITCQSIYTDFLPFAANMEIDVLGRNFMSTIVKLQDKIRIDTRELWYTAKTAKGSSGKILVDGKLRYPGHAGGKRAGKKFYQGYDDEFHEAINEQIGNILQDTNKFDPQEFKNRIIKNVLPNFFRNLRQKDGDKLDIPVFDNVKKLFEDAVDSAVAELQAE